MPLYDIRCDQGHRFERMIPLEKFSEPIECACGSPARRLISAPRFSVESVDYTCPITGKWIGSKRAHEDNLAQHGCRVLETGEKELNDSRRQQEEAKFDQAIEDTVERTIESWDSSKREALHNELVNGANDLAVTRA